MKELIGRYRYILLYLIFGGLTTGVNVASYWLLSHVFNLHTMMSTVFAWIIAVLFAYITNRKWVFESKAYTRYELVREIITFFSCRLITGVIDMLCMYIFVEIMNLNDVIIKLAANLLVIILNFVASKLIIFKKK